MKEQKLPHGHSVMGFESMEEMQAYMADAEARAIRAAIPRQWEISWGAYVLRVVDTLVIFGHIWGSSDYEYTEELEHERINNYPRGYRYGKWYSEVLPEGELGSAHVSTLWEITEQEFMAAEKNNWELDEEVGKRIAREIIDNTPLGEDKS